MSTRSAIIMKTEDGFAGIYCHFDGYETGVGQTLMDHYQDPEKVKRLIALGGLSVLGKRVEPEGQRHSYDNPEDDTTVAYGRDRGETDELTKPRIGPTVASVESKIGHNGYVYVFDGKAWTLNGEPLSAALAEVRDENHD